MFIVIDSKIVNKVTFIGKQSLRTRKITRIKTKGREKTKAKISKFTEIYIIMQLKIATTLHLVVSGL